MECRIYVIEHTHFKKKKVEKILITRFLRQLEAPKVVVIVHNPDFSDSYLEAVLSRGGLLLFFNGDLPRNQRMSISLVVDI